MDAKELKIFKSHESVLRMSRQCPEGLLTFFARWGFLNHTQGKAVETATTTAPIVAVVKRITITTRKTCK